MISLLRPTSFLTVLAALLIQPTAFSQDWPQFRGPEGNGVLSSIDHPDSWGPDRNLAWKIDVPGSGLSSPIVVGDQIFVTTAIGAAKPVNFAAGVSDMRPKTAASELEFTLLCYGLEKAELRWKKVVTQQKPLYPIHGSNSFATETPATDGKFVYAYFAATGTIAAYTLDGESVWQREIGSFPTGNGFGPGSSLCCADGKVFLQCDNDQKSFVMALRTDDGETVWSATREGKTSWSTPVYWNAAKQKQLVTCGSGFVTAYDPDSGQKLWTISGMDSSFSASPTFDAERIYFGNSGPRSSGPLLAVESDLKGDHDFNAAEQVPSIPWSQMRAGPGMPSPVVVNGNLYVSGKGLLTCYSAKDGELQFKERVSLGSAAASMWADNDRVFLMDETGKTIVFKAGNEFEILATNQLTGDVFWSTPAVAGNSLLIRGAKSLYCIRSKP